MREYKTLVIIPAYNEEKNIVKTVKDLQENAPEADYIVVNDGSADRTLEVVREHGFPYLNNLCNLGLFGAVQTGFLYAYENHYDVAIQFDGDGQHSAACIKDLVKEIAGGNDIVIGSRYVTEKKPWTKRMVGSRLISGAIHLVTGHRINDPTSGFRAYNADCIRDYATDINNPPEPDTLVYMLRKGRTIKEIQVQMNEREYGESYLNITNTIKYMGRMMISIFFVQPFRKVD